MGISWNGGTPKSSILMGCSIINHPAIRVKCPYIQRCSLGKKKCAWQLNRNISIHPAISRLQSRLANPRYPAENVKSLASQRIFRFIYIILHYITLYYIILYYVVLYHIILHYITLYYIISYYIILYYINSYYIIHILQKNAPNQVYQQLPKSLVCPIPAIPVSDPGEVQVQFGDVVEIGRQASHHRHLVDQRTQADHQLTLPGIISSCL